MDADRPTEALHWNPAIANHPTDRARVDLPNRGQLIDGQQPLKLLIVISGNSALTSAPRDHFFEIPG
jgi:hypothetical protein